MQPVDGECDRERGRLCDAVCTRGQCYTLGKVNGLCGKRSEMILMADMALQMFDAGIYRVGAASAPFSYTGVEAILLLNDGIAYCIGMLYFDKVNAVMCCTAVW